MPDINLKDYEKVAKFDSTLVENMSILSSMDNYYEWLGSILRKNSGNRILDVGCGNGNLTSVFVDKEFVMGLDPSKDYIKQVDERFKGRKNFHSILLDMTDRKRALALKKYKFDTIITMNTYEHIKDDQAAFNIAHEVLEDNGTFLIIVPASDWLYSILDYEGGHFRRYSKQELKTKMQRAGFKIEQLYFINMAGALGWYFNYVLLKKRIYSAGTFKVYNALVPLFKFSEKIIPAPFGLSLVCVGRKVKR